MTEFSEKFIMKQLVFALTCLLAFSVTAQQKEWRYVNSPFSVYAQVPNSNNICAGDGSGLIKRSTDKGVSWEIVFEGLSSSIKDIAFLDANKGVATTLTNGTFITTDDGGLTWREKLLTDSAGNVVSQYFNSVEVVNSTTYFLNPVYGAQRVFMTKDGGNNFVEKTFPGPALHVNGDTLLGFAKGSFSFRIHISYDLGETWTLVQNAPSGLSGVNFTFFGFDQLSIINSKVFFMTGGSNPKEVFKTVDGGLSFSQLSDPINNFFPKYINFSDAENGLVAGNISSSWFGVFTTNDGGLNWTSLYNSSPGGSSNAIGKLLLPFLEIGNNEIVAKRNMHTVISTDGGLTFSAQADDLSIDISISSAKVLTYNKDLWYAYAAGGNPNLGTFKSKTAVSENGGVSWNTLLDSTNNPVSLNGGVMLPISTDTLFFALGKSIGRYVKGSPSSGRLVSTYSSFGGTGVLKILQNGNQIIGIGKYFSQLSLDRGQTWRIITGAGFSGQQVVDIEFANLNEIYVLTEDNIFKSTDTTKTWVSVKQNMNLSTGATRGNNGLSLIKSNEVILYGNDARLYKTTDGGQNWTDLGPSLPTNLNFYDFRWMSFRTESHGYAGNPSPNGGLYVLETFDGGNTWSQSNPGSNMIGLLDMSFSDTTTGAAIGIFGPNVNRYNGPTNYTVDTLQAVLRNFSINENSYSDQNFYPNPSKGLIYLMGADTKKACLLSLSGQLIKEWNQPEGELHLGQFKAGIYLIQLEDYHGSIKIMKLILH
tara:strand:+ start:9782 stop:12064 length:2283 start_codon:yes stop_codon:yes gene_type:complete